MAKSEKRVSTPTYNPARKAWYKWHPALGKTVYVAGDVSPSAAMKAWQAIEGKRDAKPAAWNADGVTVKALCNRYAIERRGDAAAERISMSHYSSIGQALAGLVRFFGGDTLVDDLTPDDWTRYTRSLDRLAISSRRRSRAIILTMFRQAEADDWIDRVPKFGRAFRMLASTKGKPKVEPFTRDECQRILAEIDARLRPTFKLAASTGVGLIAMRNLKAAFLLGLNGGMTPIDLATLNYADVDWTAGMIRIDRHKTGMRRVIPLWPETIAALKAAHRPGDLLLTTRAGRPLAHQKMTVKGTVSLVDSISDRFRIVMAAAGVVKPGKGLSRLRHTCRTIASEAGDESAADILAGHRLPGMRAVYVTVDDARLIRAARHVHDWFFTPQTQP